MHLAAIAVCPGLGSGALDGHPGFWLDNLSRVSAAAYMIRHKRPGHALPLTPDGAAAFWISAASQRGTLAPAL